MANPEKGTYYIVSLANTDMYLDVSWEDSSEYGLKDGSNAQVWSRNRGQMQRFYLSYRSDGTAQITHYMTAKSIDVAGGALVSGTNVQVWTDNDTRAQKWIIEELEDTVEIDSVSYSAYRIKLEEAPTLSLTASGTSSASNVVISTTANSSNQKWVFIPFPLFESGGTYELRCGAKTSMALDVVRGEFVDGSNLHIWDANGTNAQKFTIVDEGDGWSIRPSAAAYYVGVKETTFAIGNNVVLCTRDDVPGQRWSVIERETRVIDNKTCLAVSFGIGNDNVYSMDVAGGGVAAGTNVQLWWSNLGAQIWALYPTEAEDISMPTPYSIGVSKTVGGNQLLYVAFSGANRILSGTFIPSWYSADSWANSGSNSFQIRWRTRYINSKNSTWTKWGDYNEWLPALVTRSGNRYDLTDGISVSYDLDEYASAQVEIEIRGCGINNYSLAHGSSVSQVIDVIYQPDVTLSNPRWDADSIIFDYSVDYKNGYTNIFLKSVKSGDKNILASQEVIVQPDDATTLKIPLEYLNSIPENDENITVIFSVGTNYYNSIDGYFITYSGTLSYNQHEDLSVSYEEIDDTYVLQATMATATDSKCYMIVDGVIFSCDKKVVDSNDVFTIPYPFGLAYDIYITGYVNGLWGIASAHKVGRKVGVHAWNFEDECAVLECRVSEVLSTETTLSAIFDEFEFSGRSWPATRFSSIKKAQFTATGAVVPEKTKSTYKTMERLAAKHCLYRSVTGDICYVAIASIQRKSTVQYSTITVTMSRESV